MFRSLAHKHPDDDRPKRLVHHTPLKRWSPITREERKETRAFVDRLVAFPHLTVGTSVFLAWGYLVQLVLGWPISFLLPPSAGGSYLATEILGERLGWLDADLVMAGEGWRLLSCTMLHGSLLHVAGNALVLYFLGRIVENLYGRAAFLVTYVGAGAAGAALSISTGIEHSIGASGAILGMLGVTFVLGLKHKDAIPKPLRDYFRTDMWVFVFLVGLLSLLPFVDWAGHLGGFLFGVLIGAVWPPRAIVGRPNPQAAQIQMAAAGAALGVFLFAAAVVGSRIPTVQDYLPNEDLHAMYAAIDRDDPEAVKRIADRLEDKFEGKPELQHALGQVFSSVGDYDRSLACYRAFENLAGDAIANDTWENDVAWVLFVGWPDDRTKVREGMRRVRKALREEPDDPAMLNTLSYGQVLSGKAKEGEELSAELMGNKILAQDRQVDVYIHILTLLALDRGDEALEEWNEYAPDFPAGEVIRYGDIARIKDRAEAELRAAELL
ncbi:MAG: rhomboid family intramembrane serine protease [Proteobacteria bacterium]|nr:rhomboid family intramembrane serine protease [Pseudomonadota bacterium]